MKKNFFGNIKNGPYCNILKQRILQIALSFLKDHVGEVGEKCISLVIN